MEMLRRNGLAVAGTFFQKKESHKITYRCGRHKTGGAATAAQEGEGSTAKIWQESMPPHSTNRTSLKSE